MPLDLKKLGFTIDSELHSVGLSIENEAAARTLLSSLGVLDEDDLGQDILVRLSKDQMIIRERLEQAVGKELRYFSPALVNTKSGLRAFLTDELVVRVKDSAKKSDVVAQAMEHGVSIFSGEVDDSEHNFRGRISAAVGLHVLEIAEMLKQVPHVEYAEPQYILEAKR